MLKFNSKKQTVIPTIKWTRTNILEAIIQLVKYGLNVDLQRRATILDRLASTLFVHFTSSTYHIDALCRLQLQCVHLCLCTSSRIEDRTSSEMFGWWIILSTGLTVTWSRRVSVWAAQNALHTAALLRFLNSSVSLLDWEQTTQTSSKPCTVARNWPLIKN